MFKRLYDQFLIQPLSFQDSVVVGGGGGVNGGGGGGGRNIVVYFLWFLGGIRVLQKDIQFVIHVSHRRITLTKNIVIYHIHQIQIKSLKI